MIEDADGVKRTDGADSELPFSAVLRPNRSLTPAGFIVLMAAVSLVSFITGLVFFMAGAWPVMVFFGLDVLIIYVAFKLNYRGGRAYELGDVGRDLLRVTRVAANGRSKCFDFNPYWVRVSTEPDRQGRIHVTLVSHGRSFPIAAMLSDQERLDFAAALEAALDTLKRPRFQ